MSTIKLNGTSSGSSIIKAPDSGSTNQTFTLPASSGTLVTTTDAGVAGITSSADATAITINSSEQVGIGTGSPTSPLHVLASSAGQTVAKFESNQAGALAVEIDADADRDSFFRFQEAGTTRWDFYSQGSSGGNELNIRNQSGTNIVQFAQDGRGISHFTPRAWARINQTGTQAISMHHNCSSITDNGTGDSTISFANNIGSTLYCVVTGNAAENEWSERPNPNVTATGSVRLQNVNHSSTFRDSSRVHFAVFMSQE